MCRPEFKQFLPSLVGSCPGENQRLNGLVAMSARTFDRSRDPSRPQAAECIRKPQNRCMNEPEPWLRGTHAELPAVLRAVVHALELSCEDVEAACEPLTEADLHARPGGAASIAFHLRHIPRSLDRLLTYAEGGQLNTAQLEALQQEGQDGGTDSQSGFQAGFKAELLKEFRQGLEAALGRIRAFAGADLEQTRGVGRRALPTSVGGLLVHCADHTQRHTGQLVITARMLAERSTFGTGNR